MSNDVELITAGEIAIRKQRLLVVEDEFEVRAAIRRMLELSCDVEDVATADEAIDRLMRKASPHIDCVLLDMHLENGDGLALMERFHLAAPSSALVCMTGRLFSEVEVLRGGADEFIEKPFKPREMMRAIFNAMARRESHELTKGIWHQLEKRKAELDQDAAEVDDKLAGRPCHEKRKAV